VDKAIEKYTQIFAQRVFFDIAKTGCGSGCIYCFTLMPSKPQKLLSKKTIEKMCNEIIKMGLDQKTVISLCPNTEPLKSKESRVRIAKIVKCFAPIFDTIQISTKEYIPINFLEELNRLSRQTNQIRISISLPYLDNTKTIEPAAADINMRKRNFENIRGYPRLRSVLYLRPFNTQMLNNREKYTKIINSYMPDDICIGAEFVNKEDDKQLCTYMYDKDKKDDIFRREDLESIFSFAEKIRESTKKKVFYSSLCNIANSSNYGCVLELYKYDNRYCYDCALYKEGLSDN